MPRMSSGSRNAKLKDSSIEPGKPTFPVFYVATPSGGSPDVTNGQDPYPLADGQSTQRKDAVNVVFGEGTATLTYDGSAPSMRTSKNTWQDPERPVPDRRRPPAAS